jgi:hypothetical protein
MITGVTTNVPIIVFALCKDGRRVPTQVTTAPIQNAQNEWLGVEGFTQILKSLDYPKAPLSMNTLEEKLLMYSNDIRLQDDITVIEARYFG